MRLTSRWFVISLVPFLAAFGDCRGAVFPFLKPAAGSGDVAAPPPLAAATPSVTVFPVSLGGAFVPEAANVVGVMLERAGVEQVEIETAAFVPDAAQELPQQAAAFGAFVAKRNLATDRALFASFLGSPKDGVKEVRGILVDRKGQVLWLDRQRAGETAFDRARPACPMDCAVLVVRRLRDPLAIEDPLRPGAPKGKLAKRLEAASGLPSAAEQDAMAARLATLRAAGAAATIRVFPARIGSKWSAEAAEKIALLLGERGIARATVAKAPIAFTTSGEPDEQRVLWTGARSIREAVQKAGGGTDYLLFMDFLMAAEGKAGAVHTYLLAPDGELVLVDFQNEHHDDFARLGPGSAVACAEIVAVRLASLLR